MEGFGYPLRGAALPTAVALALAHYVALLPFLFGILASRSCGAPSGDTRLNACCTRRMALLIHLTWQATTADRLAGC